MLFECEGSPWDFLGDPAVKTAHFTVGGHRFNPWSGSNNPQTVWHGQKKKGGGGFIRTLKN